MSTNAGALYIDEDGEELSVSREVMYINAGREKAFWYVAGFQDGAGDSTNTEEAWLFGRHYGDIYMAFHTEKRPDLPNLPREFQRWRAERQA